MKEEELSFLKSSLKNEFNSDVPIEFIMFSPPGNIKKELNLSSDNGGVALQRSILVANTREVKSSFFVSLKTLSLS